MTETVRMEVHAIAARVPAAGVPAERKGQAMAREVAPGTGALGGPGTRERGPTQGERGAR